MKRGSRPPYRGFASGYRLVLVAAVVLGSFGGVGVRLVHLHVIDRETLVSYVDRTRRSIVIEEARRGDILDTRGDVLATSRSLIELGVDPQVLEPDDRRKWPQLAELIGMPLAELERVFTTKTRPSGDGSEEPGRPIRWAKLSGTVEESAYAEIMQLGIKGVYGNRTYRRAYPRGQLAAHLIGYVNHEGTAAAGVERYVDFYLGGQDGWRESEKDGLRRELAQFRRREVPATDGYSVVLSIDSVIQHLIEAELQRVVEVFRPEKGTIIVSDARSGFILGLANHPTFDLNEFNRAPLAHQRNIAVTDLIEPGSTFKIVPAAGALDADLVTPGTRIDCSISSIVYRGRPRRFMRDDHAYDQPLTVAEIISRSSNVGAAQLAIRLGDDRFYGYARAFGIGEASGFPFGGEVNGLLAPPAKWSDIDITRIPAGYSVAVTPLQIHYAMSAIASGGELMRPQVIREIRDARGETVYTFGGISRRRVIREAAARQMASMLAGVVGDDGTAAKAALPGYEVAGKTGTAQKLVNGRYSSEAHVGSFVGFFPASRPRVVISVIIDGARMPPGRIAYGSSVAAPSFKKVAEQLIPYLDIQPVAAPTRSLLAMEGGSR